MGDYCETSKNALHFGDGKCVEVRLSLLEHHFFHKVMPIATTQHKIYYLTQALLSGIHSV